MSSGTEVTTEQLRQLVSRPRRDKDSQQSGQGRSLSTILQDAIVMDNVALFERLQDVCDEVAKEESEAAASRMTLEGMCER